MRPWRPRSPPQWLRLLLLLLPVELPLRLLPLRKRRLRSQRKKRAASKVLAPCSAETTIGTN
jgi:hypothetical protein